MQDQMVHIAQWNLSKFIPFCDWIKIAGEILLDRLNVSNTILCIYSHWNYRFMIIVKVNNLYISNYSQLMGNLTSVHTTKTKLLTRRLINSGVGTGTTSPRPQ